MTARRTLSQDDWLEKALSVLLTDGVGGVRVLRLAKALGVTRGSFYWHFRNRQDLLDHLLDYWDREFTDPVIRHVEKAKRRGRKRILALAEFILRMNATRYDMAIRNWADGDRKAAKGVRRVMRKRLDYVTGLFREAGFSPADARARGHLLAIYLMSEGAIHDGESFQMRLKLLRRQVRTLTAQR